MDEPRAFEKIAERLIYNLRNNKTFDNEEYKKLYQRLRSKVNLWESLDAVPKDDFIVCMVLLESLLENLDSLAVTQSEKAKKAAIDILCLLRQTNKACDDKIEMLDITATQMHYLKNYGVFTIGQLQRLNDENFRQIRGFGAYNTQQIRNKVDAYIAGRYGIKQQICAFDMEP